MALYARIARWELRGNVLKKELWAHAATCECECPMCDRLNELAHDDEPRIEWLFLRTVDLTVSEVENE